jgi:hypothetical protein
LYYGAELALACDRSANNMARLLEVDDFIADLWKVHQAVKKEGYVQVSTHVKHCGFA